MVTIQTAPTLILAMFFLSIISTNCHCFTLIMLIVLWAYAIWSIKLFFFFRPFLNCLLGLIDQTTCYFSSSVELAFCTLLGLRLPNLETIAAPALLLLLSLNSSMVVGLLQLEAQNFFLLFIPTPPHRVVYQTLLLKMIKNDMILEIIFGVSNNRVIAQLLLLLHFFAHCSTFISHAWFIKTKISSWKTISLRSF